MQRFGVGSVVQVWVQASEESAAGNVWGELKT